MKIPVSTAALANLSHWRAGQGARIKANRPLPVYLACEYLARSLAAVRDPLELSALELAGAVKAAIGQERKRLHPGPVETISADEWWDQISAIAEGWGISARREDWTAQKPERKAAA